MARIEPIDPAGTSEKVREALDALPPLNIFRTLAHAQTAVRPFLRFGGAVLTRLELDPLVRELAILVVARDCEAEYEWIQHVAIAKAVGASDEQIGALEAGAADGADIGADRADRAAGRADTAAARADTGAGRADAGVDPFDAPQRAAIDFAGAVVASPRISDALFERVRAHFSEREIVELLLTIGDYWMLARVMTVLELDLDEPAGAELL